MSKLTNLKSLAVTFNHIHDLPKRIGDMAALETVDFKNNDIELIPYSILRCSNLTKLNLMNNSLIKLPDLLGTMPALAKLDVAGNRLTMLPFSLGFSKTLVDLYVHDNPLVDPPVAECDKGIKHVMWYMRNRMHIVNRGMPPVMRYHQTGLKVRLGAHLGEHRSRGMLGNIFSFPPLTATCRTRSRSSSQSSRSTCSSWSTRARARASSTCS
jgi:hypothetical protein